MMMASSSSSVPSSNGPQDYQAPKLTRQNSSFLGTIKNLVTVPLSWFGNVDGGADVTGSKRRRPGSGSSFVTTGGVQESHTEILVEDKEGSSSVSSGDELEGAARRSKRMRLSSPQRTTRPTTGSVSAIRRSSVVPRASSAVLPSSRGTSRGTLSPKRHLQLHPATIQRTMSIDPPQLASSDIPSSSSFNFTNADVDMTGFDSMSMPSSPTRLSPRPSFRMRSSLTPQPALQNLPQRHISEPPPLNALLSKPVFVHPPLQEEATPVPASIPTLGSLVESTRRAGSPVKQHHGSLLFTNSNEEEFQMDVPAERALQQLDVYKTPLLPSRMRAGTDSITAKVIPDMFKSRRASRLVLMPDDRERSSGKKNKGPVVNETKPYAGEGGMKKLLARAKLEAEKEKEKEKEKDDKVAKGMDDTGGQTSRYESASVPPPPPPPPAPSDWFKSAVSGASAPSSGSSLRVGRQKTSRNHIQRPTKSKFSAVYEEEGDDTMEDDERAKERQMLEEAAKKVPVFNIPAGFTFAKDTPAPLPNANDLEKAKEPPIQSLPFSLSKPSTPSEPPKPDAGSKEPQSSTPSTPFFGTTPGAAQPSLPTIESAQKTTPVPTSQFFSLGESASTGSSLSLPNGCAVPNFFANSQLLKEKSLPALTPPASTSTPPAGASPFGIPPAASVVTDESNPFLDGHPKEQVKPQSGRSSASSSSFPCVPKPEAMSGPSHAPVPSPFTFGKPEQETTPPVPPPNTHGKHTENKPAPLPFSFDKPVEEKPASVPFLFGRPVEDKPAVPSTMTSSTPSIRPFSFGNSETKSTPAANAPFSFNAPAEVKKPETEAFRTSHVTQSGSTTTSGLFGEPLKAASPFPVPPPQSTPSPLPFTFGSLPSTETSSSMPTTTETPKSVFTTPVPAPSPAVEAPKSLFGGSTISEKNEPEIKSTSFSFGGAPGAPSAASEVKPVPIPAFTFGQPSTTPAVGAPPIAFSFSGGGSAGTDVTTKSAFGFGVPSSSAVAHPERPVTPPKTHDQEVRMEESPVRDMQINGKPPEMRPVIGGSFSFGAGSNGVNGSSPFGSTSSGTTSVAPATTTPFAFGASSTSSNPFAAKKPEESKPFGGFGAPQAPPINTSFSFGKEENRPASAGAFTFGQTPTSATNPTFPFGANPNPNPFGSATGSAPGSPSTYAQPTPFTFGAPAAASSSSPFTFGSQPSSPAAGANLTLPQPTTSTTTLGNGTGFGQTPSPSSPFTAPLPLAQSTSGGPLFTIGAAPAPSPVGQRQIKKLPRRGNAKR